MLGMMSKPEPVRSGMISKKKTYLVSLVMLVDGVVMSPGRKPDKTLESDHGSVVLELD